AHAAANRGAGRWQDCRKCRASPWCHGRVCPRPMLRPGSKHRASARTQDRGMDTTASFNRIAALIGDRARVDMLTALMAGRALTATELADHAGVARPTASAHLAALTGAGLLEVEKQGRHRYF